MPCPPRFTSERISFFRLLQTESASTAAPKRASARLKDPEVAAKHKAFLQKVSVATNGSMESFLEQEATKMETSSGSSSPSVVVSACPASQSTPTITMPALKRKALPTQNVTSASAVTTEPECSPTTKRQRNSRNSSSGQVSHVLFLYSTITIRFAAMEHYNIGGLILLSKQRFAYFPGRTVLQGRHIGFNINPLSTVPLPRV